MNETLINLVGLGFLVNRHDKICPYNTKERIILCNKKIYKEKGK